MSRSLRILHTVEYFAPRVGGAERVVEALSTRLVERGHEVTVATSHDDRRGGGREVEGPGGVRVRQYRIRGNEVKRIRAARGEAERYRRDLREGGWDVVLNYAAQAWPTDLAWAAVPHLEAATVLAPCGFSGLSGWRRLLYLPYFRRMPGRMRSYDAVVYHSASYRDAAFGRRHGIEGVVIPNGVDSAELAGGPDAPSFRRAYGIHRERMLLAVSNHYRDKGHDRLWRVWRALRESDPDLCLALVGEDPGGLASCGRRCRARARRDPGWIVVSGVPRPLVAAAFREAELVLLASRVEAFPLVALEAMATGTPFVAREAGALGELPGGVTVDSMGAMPDAVRRLLADGTRRRELGDAGRAAQRDRYEWDRIVDRYEGLYMELAER